MLSRLIWSVNSGSLPRRIALVVIFYCLGGDPHSIENTHYRDLLRGCNPADRFYSFAPSYTLTSQILIPGSTDVYTVRGLLDFSPTSGFSALGVYRAVSAWGHPMKVFGLIVGVARRSSLHWHSSL